MSDIDKSSKSLIAIQKMIDQMTRDPLGDFVKQQEQMLNMASKMASAFDLNKTVIKISVDPLNSFQKQFLSPLEPYLNSINTTKIQCEAITEPYIRMQKILSDSFRSPVYTSFAKNDILLNQSASIQEYVNSLSSLFQGICIHENYVSVPDAIIPEGFSFDEYPLIEESGTNDLQETISSNTPFCKLSKADAITLICTLLCTLLTIISFMKDQLDTSHEQLIALQEEQVSLQKEENELLQMNNQLLQKQIDATYEQAKFLATLLEELQPLDEDSPVAQGNSPNSDSTPSDADLNFQYAASKSSTAHSEPSIDSDEFYSSESQTEPESQ